jgi:hypothetical protein
MTRNEYTVDGFEQETIDERIDALLEFWGIDEDDDSFEADYRRQKAFNLAVSEPSEITTDLFMRRVARQAMSM